MADVIRDALDAHTGEWLWHTISCRAPGCGWEFTATFVDWDYDDDACRRAHRAHQAEVATAAVLEVVDQVLDGWLDQPQATRALKGIAAALAEEG